jgi:hypothetical protein
LRNGLSNWQCSWLDEGFPPKEHARIVWASAVDLGGGVGRRPALSYFEHIELVSLC